MSADTRNLKDYFLLTARGFAMGAADIVPGVSGGTMAFILGIYDELLEAIHAVDAAFVRRLVTLRWREIFDTFPWRFLLAIFLGIFLAVFSLSNALHWALEEHPSLLWAFFFGLIVASIWVVRARVRWTVGAWAVATLAGVGAFFLVGFTPTHTPETPLFFFISGAIAICAMILPGISGAFILVLLGKYQQVLNAVINFDIVTLALVASGSVIGLLLFANLLRWLLHRHHDLTVAALIGFITGSLREVYPWKQSTPLPDGLVLETNILPAAFTLEVGLALLLMAFGFVLVLGMERAAKSAEFVKKGDH